jgi:predicted PurR-regulated permease PerM
MRQPNWTRILTILLVILAAYAVLYFTGIVLSRFRHVIVIFILGALVAYVLSPMVRQLEGAVRVRWLAILTAYVLLALGLLSLSVFLFTPFVEQSQSLVDNLQNPSSGSLQAITRVECGGRQVVSDLRGTDAPATCGGGTLMPGSHARAQGDIDALHRALSDLERGVLSGPRREPTTPRVAPGRQPPNPQPQTQVPPSYIKQIRTQITAVSQYYLAAQQTSGPMVKANTAQAITHAGLVASDAKRMYDNVSTTPILLLRAQTWLDEHGIALDVHDRFGDVGRQLSNQGTNILNNAVTIIQETANTLLNVALVLIIAFYILSDGNRLIARGLNLIPGDYREQVWFFVSSLDRVLGGYIRGQLFLSALAGVLGGAGAAALGVPYPLLIGILTFLLESVPVIGPMVAIFPAVLVSLFFEPVLTTVILLVWNVLFQQLVTNIIGPRVMGIAVGIHPLEAMLAVLVGYPLAGFLGAFLAVPVAGILHIVIRELYGYFALGRELPTATPDLETVDVEEDEAVEATAPVPTNSGRSPAAS